MYVEKLLLFERICMVSVRAKGEATIMRLDWSQFADIRRMAVNGFVAWPASRAYLTSKTRARLCGAFSSIGDGTKRRAFSQRTTNNTQNQTLKPIQQHLKLNMNDNLSKPSYIHRHRKGDVDDSQPPVAANKRIQKAATLMPPPVDESSPKYPGAVPVAGMKAATGGTSDEFTITAPASVVAPRPPSIAPVSARLVDSNEQNMEELQEQLRYQGEQLEKVLAGIQNAPVASVVSHGDVEAQDATNKQVGDSPPTATSGDGAPTSTSKEPTTKLCSTRMKWIIGIVIILAIGVAVALGVVLSKPSTTTTTTSDENASQQCDADQELLQSNGDISAASILLYAELKEDYGTACTALCTYDFKEYKTYSTFVAACQKAGGDLYTVTDEVNCLGSNFNYLDIKFIDRPLCVAPSCDVWDFVEKLDADVDEVAQTKEEEYSNINLECTSPDSVVYGPF
jgi:hypothetical protein